MKTGTNDGLLRQLVLGLVGHFSAKHILERHAGNLPSNINVEFKLIAMPRSNMPVGSWDDMQQLIHRVAKDHAPPASDVLVVDKYVKKIEKHINAYDSADNRSFYHFIFDVFSAIRRGESPTFKGDKHCEAILAAVILYFQDTTRCKLTEDGMEAIEALHNLREVFWWSFPFASL
jgi:hypothetical protein